MRKLHQLLCCMLVLALIIALTGCNTWAGFGKDLQRGGEAIEDSTE